MGGGGLFVFSPEYARCEHDASTRRGTCLRWGGSSVLGLPARFGSSLSPSVGGGLAVWPSSAPFVPYVPASGDEHAPSVGGKHCASTLRGTALLYLFFSLLPPHPATLSIGGTHCAWQWGSDLSLVWGRGRWGGGGGAKYMHVASTRGTILPFPWVAAVYPRFSGRCCPLAVVATSLPGVQCPVPAPSCAHTYWRRYIPGWNRKMRKCGHRGGLTVRLEGFLRHPLPWTRGGPLCRHPTARGGLTAHPLPGACVSTSERPDTGAVVSVRWKWRLQSAWTLSSPGSLPPPSAMEAPEVPWQ